MDTYKFKFPDDVDTIYNFRVFLSQTFAITAACCATNYRTNSRV